jgi:cysteine synthase
MKNGFGDHRIEGTGDKHVPWILNAKDQDVLVGIDGEAAMHVFRLFNTDEGYAVRDRQGAPAETITELDNLSISVIDNLLGCIKMAKHFELTEKEVLLTVATDSAMMYGSHLKELEAKHGKYCECQACADFFRYLVGGSERCSP